MKVVKTLADELSEADLAVFGIEDHEDMASATGITSIGYSLDALPDREHSFAKRRVTSPTHGAASIPCALRWSRSITALQGDGDGGHIAEEAFLTEATARWRDVLRTEDLMGRWREDEFAVVLVNCSTVSAVQLCWRLREATPEGHSFSAGLASFQGTETVDDLVERADDCLAQARAKGRDRTVAEGLVDLD